MSEEERNRYSEEFSKAMANFMLDGDQARLRAELDRIGGQFMESINRLAQEAAERRASEPPKSYEQVRKEFEEMVLIDAAEAVVALREELEKWSQDVIEMFLEPQVHNWINANSLPGRERPDEKTVKLQLAEELNGAIIRKLFQS